MEEKREQGKKGGLIGEGCWELRAGQQGTSGRRKDRMREEMPEDQLRWIIRSDGIKQNKLPR